MEQSINSYPGSDASTKPKSCSRDSGKCIKSVAVIGAGISGLATVKSLLEDGFEPTCYEFGPDIGGIWRFTEKREPEQGACVYETLLTNTTKGMSCFSDFPHSEDTPTYLTHSEMFSYLHNYANHFGLKKYIHTGTCVVNIQPTSDHQISGRWEVTSKSTSSGEEKSVIFDAVVICCGRYKEPIIPNIPGKEDFNGTQYHSIEFRRASDELFRGKKVLVIGNAHTAGDITTACTPVAKEVCISIGKGTYIAPRVTPNGIPLDMNLTRIASLAPNWVANIVFGTMLKDYFDNAKYGLKSPLPPSNSPLMLNDYLAGYIISGDVKFYPYVKNFTKNGVEFQNGESKEFDIVIFCTGYRPHFSFIDKNIFCDDTGPALYNLVWPTNRTHNSLAVVGCFSARGTAFIGTELMARWVSNVFGGKFSLPDQDEMVAEVRKRKEYNIKTFGLDKCLPDCPAVTYADRIAVKIGCYPSFWKLVWKNPRLAFQCIFGPPFASQYRLLGPHSWDGAADTCLNAFQNSMDKIGNRFPIKVKQKMSVFYTIVLPIAGITCLGVMIQMVRFQEFISRLF